MADDKKKILIVEDDKDFLWFFRQSFASQGLNVVFAEDGEKGLEMARSEKPDLAVFDIMLPKMNGIEVAKKIKEDGSQMKMIFLTNLKDADHVSQVLGEVGELDYFVKADVDIDTIIKRAKEKLGIE